MRKWLFTIFFISGFSGLIYESVWSHYLKTILGHAAYAQTIVLIIFMGGMAAGAWLASRLSFRLDRPLRAYAIAEGAIGLAGLLFHSIFIGVEGALFDFILPATDSVLGAQSIKWGIAGLLILPQSVVLGMTFPLMSVGLVRRTASKAGNSLALLYFTNSLGAALGVLCAAFLLVPNFGLPGAILIAGIINILLAAWAWFLDKSREAAAAVPPKSVDGGVSGMRLFAIAAFITGLASFCYEIGWIRMLSMVLGSTTQAFELMLAAFIAGLAFGGLWVRKRLDNAGDLLRFAAIVQLLMGVFALLTIPAYNETFGLMSWMLDALSRNASGYALFNTASLVIAMLIMVPVTFLAGMTLPLFTKIAMDYGSGEAGIGRIYASNTLGAIVGVIISVHLLLPLTGTRGVIIVGASFDILLAYVLLSRSRLTDLSRVLAVGSGSLLLVAIFVFRLDPLETASGVYRHGVASLPEGTEVLFHVDGKTTTVDVTQSEDRSISIRTNGKPDAQIAPLDMRAAPDEVTMILAGILPHALRPDARTAANIGMGSGLSSHALLADQELEILDTIEIERAMVEGARYFGERNVRAYEDPRSRIHIEDAKSFFSTHGKRYDIIVSEPSNPWISGVASLFSLEFYHRIQNYMTDDGVLVQWLQLYETDINNLVSVLKALSAAFPHYSIYHTDDANVLIVASQQPLRTLDESVFYDPLMSAELSRVEINTLADIQARWAGDESLLDPFIDSYRTAANSDFYPFLAYEAPRTRYLGSNLVAFSQIHSAPVPVVQMLSPFGWQPTDVSTAGWRSYSGEVGKARDLRDAVLENHDMQHLDEQLQYALNLSMDAAKDCTYTTSASLLASAHAIIAVSMNQFLGRQEAVAVWEKLAPEACLSRWPENVSHWLALHRAAAARNPDALMSAASRLLESGKVREPWQLRYVALATLGSAVAQDLPDRSELAEVWIRRHPGLMREDTFLRMLSANAIASGFKENRQD